MIRVVFANFAEDSFPHDVMTEEGTTLEDFLEEQGVSVSSDSFRVSVDGQIATLSTVLKEGQRVRVTPRKMNGA